MHGVQVAELECVARTKAQRDLARRSPKEYVP